MTDNKNAAEGGEVEKQEEQTVVEKKVEGEAEVSEKAPEEAAQEEATEGEKAEEAQAEKPKGKVNPFRNRISELTAATKERDRKLEAAMARIAELEAGQQKADESEGADKPTDTVPTSVAREWAKKEAERIAAADRFNTDCNAAFDQGVKAYPDFTEAMDNFGALGGLEPEVVEDALATGAAHQVLYDLGSNPEEAVRILKLPRGRRIAEFTRMTVKSPVKPTVSKAAAPIKPVGGSAKQEFDPTDASIPDEEWHRREDERERNRRRA